MELIETTPEQAKACIEAGTRVIKATKGKGMFAVAWINTNNYTFMLNGRKKGSQLMQNCEDYRFFIQVPKNAKTVF